MVQFMVQNYYNTRKEDRVVDVCLHSVCDRTDDVSCLCEQGAYANTYVDRQVGKIIKTLGPSVLIGWTSSHAFHRIYKYR